MTGFYEPEGDLAAVLRIEVRSYEEEFESYWDLTASEPPPEVDPDEWRLGKLLDALGSGVLNCAHTLVVTPGLIEAIRAMRPGDDPVESIKDLAQYVITQDRLEIQLARVACDLMEDAKKRVLQLLFMLSKFSLSPRAAAFLDRATRLYVGGFDSEVIVMCRAVLEAALEERIDETELRTRGFIQGRYGYQVWQYV